MPEEEEDNKKKAESPKVRKPRPEIQIYRPGMMRRGTDLTTTAEPSSGSKPPEESKRRPPRAPAESRQVRTSDGPRRRSNDTDSVHSYRNDSGSTTPDASVCSERRNSFGRGGATRTFTRGGGRRNNERFDDARSDYSYRSSRNRDYDEYSSRNGLQFSSRQGSRDDLSEAGDYSRPRRNQGAPQQKPYNSTQSLYDSRQPGGYLDYRSSPNKRYQNRRDYTSDSAGPARGRFQRQVGNSVGDRASMRAEAGQRRTAAGGGRRRNDSINSTQSERPPPNQALSIDTSLETQSQAGDAPASSTSLSYLELCKSFESIGSLDWSQEVENEYNEKLRLEEEQKTKELQQRLEACANGTDVQSAVQENRGAPVRGILRLNISDTAATARFPAGRGPPPIHPRGHQQMRGRGSRRHRRDSGDSSSFGGSIAEEVESADDQESGERTPTKEREQTDRRWSKSGGRQSNGYGRSPRRHNQNYAGSRSARYHENEDPRESREVQSARDVAPMSPKYRGGHDLEREEVAPSRLKGRLSIQPQRTTDRRGAVENGVMSSEQQQQRNPNRRNGSDRMVSSSNSSRRNRDSANPDEMAPPGSRNMADWPVYKEISKKEGPQIQKINEAVSLLLPRVSSKRDVDSARKLVEYSSQLSAIYYELMTRDVNFTFSVNLEQHLWKQAYHKMIEALKTGTNSVRDSAKPLRLVLLNLLTSGIDFYNRLVALYESEFSFCVADCIVWPSGSPSDDFRSLISAPLARDSVTSSKQKIALKSISRYFVALGDLHRYKTLVEGSEDYSTAKSWYLKASLLWPNSGHPYNQLAVVAFYSMLYRSTRRARHTPLEILSSQRQERVVDEIFFCVRALCAAYPFEAARERLFARLAAMRKKVDKYEPLLDIECGRVRVESEIAARRDQPRELWMTSSNVLAEMPERNVFEMYREQAPSQLHRRTISYLIHTAGLLISKIGMEQFNSVSSRAFSQLAALVQLAESPATCQQLVQLSLILIYAVHATGLKGVEMEGACSVQQQMAVQSIISLFGAMLRPLHAVIGQLGDILSGAVPCPKEVSRVLPAISVLSEWFSCPQASSIYRTMPSAEPLPIETVELDTWGLLADLANVLADLDDSGQLAKATDETGASASKVLPELLFVSSFISIFPPTPRVLHVKFTGDQSENADLSLHCRLRSLLSAAEFIDGSQMSSFYFDEKKGKFTKHDLKEEALSSAASGDTDRAVDSTIDSTQTATREELLQREQQKRQAVLVVNPTYLVPDTNALVDHLDTIKRIVESDQYQVLLSTIVIEELLGLSQTREGEAGSEHAERVAAESRRCVAWLREQAKRKCARMNTLTTKGKKLGLCIVMEETDDHHGGKVNDDRILDACTAFVELSPAPPMSDVTLPASDAPPIYRNLVLLTEDRGICIKATSQNIPTRNLPSFCRWANLT